MHLYSVYKYLIIRCSAYLYICKDYKEYYGEIYTRLFMYEFPDQTYFITLILLC